MKASATHAGGVVVRRDEGVPKYLLVSTKDFQQWVLPKGHVERGETLEQTALREVLEETGVVARSPRRLPRDLRFTVWGKELVVAFFLMECVEETKASENRKKAWLPIERAVERASHEETKAVLRLAAATVDTRK
jgi:8-oxo-dGTP pyrophosphatase MutT (NUDIX family)